MLNPFALDAFNTVSLTQAINILPNNYGRVGQLGVFPGKGIRTRTVVVEERHGVLNLLPTLPVGSPGTEAKHAKRKVRSFTVPHIPHDDVLLPADYDSLRAFGSETDVEALASVLNERLQTMRNKHAITLEHLRMGALKGVILDADGSVIYNLFTEFEIQQKTVDFVLGTSGTDVAGKCREVLRHIEDNLMGEVMTGVRCLVSSEFFDKLIGHANVKDAYKYHSAAERVLGGDNRSGFTFGGITFEEYRGQATDMNGTVRRFINASEGHAYPTGTMSAFNTLFAPADFTETVNTVGLEAYAKIEPRKFDRGIDIHTQSNPLPICYRPGVLVRVITSN